MSATSYHIVLLGDGGVGKTSFVRALQGMRFEPRYLETTGINISAVEASGHILTIYDVAGQEKYTIEQALKQALNENKPALTIIMYELTSKTSYKNATRLWSIIGRGLGAPVLMVGTKDDIAEKRVVSTDPKISSKKNEISDFMKLVLEKIIS